MNGIHASAAPPTNPPPHLAAHIQWMSAAGMSPLTMTTRIGVVTRAHAAIPGGIELAEPGQLAAWLAQGDWAASSRYTYWSNLWAYLDWLVLMGKLDRHPMRTLRRPRVPRGLPRPVDLDVLHDVLSRAKDPWRTCVILASYAGLRCCEIARIERADITARRLTVTGKGSHRLTVPTHPAVWATVRDLPPGLIIESVGGRACAQYVSVGASSYFRRQLGLPAVGLHRFRHLFGTRVYQSTRDLLVTRDALRHSSVSTTQGYAELEDEAVAQAVTQLPMPDLPEDTAEGCAGKQTPLDPDQAAA